MGYFDVIINTMEFQTFLKLILILILSGFIGLEREALSKPAGIRTHVLVGISAVLVCVCGQYFNNKTGADPTRIPAQLISGIGFLGAGTILRDGFNVKGLTTAATLLTVTCIGLAVGAGFYMGAILATIFVYIVLSFSHKLIGTAGAHINIMDIEILVDNPRENLNNIEKILDEYKMEILNIKTENKNGTEDSIRVQCKIKNTDNKNKIITSLMSIQNVKQVIEI